MRSKFASIRFGSVFMGFINYNYFLHGFLTLLTTYYSQVICFLLLPFYLTSTTLPALSKSGNQRDTSGVLKLPMRFAGPLIVKLLFMEGLLLSWFSSLEASLERTSLLFPERIAPLCLFNLCLVVCFFIFCTAMALTWRNIAEIEGKSPTSIEDEEMLKTARN